MPIQYPTFTGASDTTPSIPDYGKAIASGLTNYINAAKAQYAPSNEKALNQVNLAKGKYADQRELAGLNSTLAGTDYTRAGTQGLNITNQELGQRLHEQLLKEQTLNQFLPDSEKARIARENAMVNYYKTGGPGSSTGSKDYQAYVNGISQDNPGLSQEQLREASDTLAKGGAQLSDGTMLNPMSFGTRTALDRAVKASTTAQQINQGLGANQAEAESDTLLKYAEKGISPYADTLFDKSPKQIMDTFKSDDKSQKKLGEFIAAQALQYEIAQQRVKLAGGQPGITATEGLIDLSKQVINAKYPRLTGKARKAASDYMTEALKEGLKSRNRFGYAPGSLVKATASAQNLPSSGTKNTHNHDDYDVPAGWIGLFKNGEAYYFPPNLVNQKLSEGYTYE